MLLGTGEAIPHSPMGKEEKKIELKPKLNRYIL